MSLGASNIVKGWRSYVKTPVPDRCIGKHTSDFCEVFPTRLGSDFADGDTRGGSLALGIVLLRFGFR